MLSKIQFILNNENIEIEIVSTTILLDFIRDHSLKGTKVGCREGDCGACTVLVGEFNNGELRYHTVTSCLTPLGNIHGKHVVTVEGLSEDKPTLIQLEIVNSGGTQCGYCTPGFVVSLTSSSINKTDYMDALDGNICRCTGYNSIKKAAESIQSQTDMISANDLESLYKNNIIPNYFLNIADRLSEIGKIADMDGVIIGGGTDLYVQKRHSISRSNARFLGKNYRYIIENDTNIHIGSGSTMTDIINSPLLKNIIKTDNLRLIASTQIRNSATIGGNIINASPIGDFTIIFLALNAKLVLSYGDSKRTIYLHDLYQGYKDLDMGENELFEELIIIKKLNNYNFNFEKVSKRTQLDIASVNTAISILYSDKIDYIKISAGGVYAIPFFLRKTCAFLKGKVISSEVIRAALVIADGEISPISDVRGSISYKRLLLRQLILAHFIELFPNNMEIKEVIQ